MAHWAVHNPSHSMSTTIHKFTTVDGGSLYLSIRDIGAVEVSPSGALATLFCQYSSRVYTVKFDFDPLEVLKK